MTLQEPPTYLPEKLTSREPGMLDAQALAAALARPIVFVDLETTGADAQRDRITEIGVVEVGPDGIQEWDTLVDPLTSIPPFVQGLTGITDEMVRGQPTFALIAEALAEKLQGRLFVAHNARFDYGFLKNEFRRAGVTFRADVLCTLRLSRSLFPSVERHGLDALIARFGLTPKGRHRALADAELLWQFWQKIHEIYSVDLVESAVTSLVKHASLPAGLEETALDDVPDRPGVYLFYGDDDVPLYVGKSIHLRQRIRAHFAGDHSNAREMRLSRSVRRVEWHETGGEIGALLSEAHLVKTLRPLHNHLLRQNTELFSWEMLDGLPAPRLRSDRHVDFSRHAALYGAFPSRASAQARLRSLADEHRLCLATLMLEGTTRRGSPCFARQLHRCAGACTGEESQTAHRERTVEAMASMAIQRWPFAGAIAWREASGDRFPWHIIEDWCYLGSAPTLEDAARQLVAPARFDIDTYQILAPRIEELKASAVPLLSTREFVLTPPVLPEPRAARVPRTAGKHTANASEHSQTPGLFS
ncbi:DNA polymerase III subunit epsilon [Cupriavidus metallidurans]|jgi:DNA polymerase-3 subunit epsilon|uniref:3'-5' exonuclease family protein n=1 Tax=Cupriavidus TaxID=106589 RepID=UPI0004939C9D|nr:3'-5' exonuclease family protein [Cupriavidus metallidurans]AVA35015.1 ethanolamine utilization protein [Cupriavidus metallidurans]KWW34153.1 Excinuclease cho [Cupriavidus metallidurans]MDE4921402.1 exonuclease domain-containing protein [Cupriavidus metallidurans]